MTEQQQDAQSRPARTRRPGQSHVTSVEADSLGLRYWGACSCGWTPYGVSTWRAADALCAEHRTRMGAAQPARSEAEGGQS